ncbi:hypothetical protein FRX31_018353 [Thalictrum thalictroides]|uniref:Uncharacterized protein n=1 Tax=Thalictrum thalictroides TaxID=46969 RepID=A0A7J6W3W0_THATH|nr:hypothetical protein FRX31_018353 [Thalictrum thalictroides]
MQRSRGPQNPLGTCNVQYRNSLRFKNGIYCEEVGKVDQGTFRPREKILRPQLLNYSNRIMHQSRF